MIPRDVITGLVLAGGEGRRMGGRDKGWLTHHGQPLVVHALQRLQPQVGPLAISANRQLDDYRRFGLPVWPDDTDLPGPFAGPLAGWCTALRRAQTPFLATVPCDVPGFPVDLVDRLAAALSEQQTEIAIAAVSEPAEASAAPRWHPVFALLRADLHTPLAQALHAGERRVATWVRSRRHTLVRFEDAAAFANLNTPDDLDAG